MVRHIRRMLVGYARISTEVQNLDLQRQALEEAGCDAIHEDMSSGAASNRKGLSKALRQCSSGDVLVVWKLDRLGRSMFDLVALAETLKRRNIGLKVLTGQGASIDTTRPEGRVIFAIFAALAEFERELIRERTRAGMAAARRNGVTLGRPHKLSKPQIERAARMISEGRIRKEVAAELNVSVLTLRRALNVRNKAE